MDLLLILHFDQYLFFFFKYTYIVIIRNGKIFMLFYVQICLKHIIVNNFKKNFYVSKMKDFIIIVRLICAHISSFLMVFSHFYLFKNFIKIFNILCFTTGRGNIIHFPFICPCKPFPFYHFIFNIHIITLTPFPLYILAISIVSVIFCTILFIMHNHDLIKKKPFLHI